MIGKERGAMTAAFQYRPHRMLRLMLVALAGGMGAGTAIAAPAPCEALTALAIGDGTITAAKPVTRLADIAKNLGEAPLAAPFCRIEGYLTPTADSHIGFELWLPDPERWNRKFQAVGNGGFLGTINQRASVAPVLNDYAVMTTDLGHRNAPGKTEDASWAPGHPDKVIDYAWRGQHLATVAAKKITQAYYGVAPAHSYFTGCSAGGIRGLINLFRFPKDFDGYLIGAAHADHIGQEFAAMWNTLEASLKNPVEALRPAQVTMLHSQVLRQCVKAKAVPGDAFLSDPQSCRFDVKALTCKPGQAPDSCLSAAQVQHVERIYRGPVNPRTGKAILAGIMPGSELSWDRYFTGKTNPAQPDRPWSSFMGYIANTPDWLNEQKYQGFDFDRDIDAVKAKIVGGEPLGSSWNAADHDLEAFRVAGGKLIQYHGWDDPNIPPLAAAQLLADVTLQQARGRKLSPAKAEAATAEFYRLFMVPGMGHCSGGDGPWAFGQPGQDAAGTGPDHDPVAALERWVEQGVPPEQFIGMSPPDKAPGKEPAKAPAGMTRPICRYPLVPVYKGQGSTDEADNFTCARRKSG
jgi:feruloyl esterase